MSQIGKQCVYRHVVQKCSKTGYKGVSFHKASGKYRACIEVNKKHIHLGLFVCKLEAAKAYNKAAKEHFGEFAKLNEV